jgi:hypothetical protein
VRTIEEIKADLEYAVSEERCALTEKLYNELCGAIADGIPVSELETMCTAWKDKRCVVLPCKVGDTVHGYPSRYVDGTGKHFKTMEWKVACIHYSINKSGEISATFRASVWEEYRGKKYAYYTEDIPFSDFGQTVFLTRPEAEAALRNEDATNE